MTLTGLGERSHLANPEIDLDTYVADVVNLMKFEDLHDVVLVGHSYAGLVVTAEPGLGAALEAADHLQCPARPGAADDRRRPSLVR